MEPARFHGTGQILNGWPEQTRVHDCNRSYCGCVFYAANSRGGQGYSSTHIPQPGEEDGHDHT